VHTPVNLIQYFSGIHVHKSKQRIKRRCKQCTVFFGQIEACNQQIETYLNQLESKFDSDPEVKPLHVSKNEPSFDLATHLYCMTEVDFTEMDGLNVLTVQSIFSEVGLNPEPFGTSKRFSSWLGLYPEDGVTDGKIKSVHRQENC